MPDVVALLDAIYGPGYRQEMIYERSTQEKDTMTSWVKQQLDALAITSLPSNMIFNGESVIAGDSVNTI